MSKLEEVGIQKLLNPLSNFMDYIEKYQNGDRQNIKTGFSSLDDCFDSQLDGGKVFCIAARPSVGKSTFAMNLAENLSKNINVLYFSLEMTALEIVERLICKNSRVTSKKMKTKGMLTNTDYSRIANALTDLNQLNLYISEDTSIEIKKIEKYIKLMIDEVGLKAVFIDYLQLLGSSSMNRVLEISQITRQLKKIAMEHSITIFVVSQLSRATENRVNKRPQLSDLRDSGSIEQDCDVVLGIYREELYSPENIEQQGIAEISILKNRAGKCESVNLKFVGEFYEFSEYDPFTHNTINPQKHADFSNDESFFHDQCPF